MNLDAVKFDAFYLVKLIFGKYFRHFNANRVADLLQLDAILVPVRERVNMYSTSIICCLLISSTLHIIHFISHKFIIIGIAIGHVFI